MRPPQVGTPRSPELPPLDFLLTDFRGRQPGSHRTDLLGPSLGRDLLRRLRRRTAAFRRDHVLQPIRGNEEASLNRQLALMIDARDSDDLDILLSGDRSQLLIAGKRSEEHTSELQSLMRNSYAVFC